MKIESDLRIAIRAAVNAFNESIDSGNYHAKRREAVRNLAASPKHKAKVVKAAKQIKAATEVIRGASEVFERIGVTADLNYIRDEDAFVKAGGKLEEKAQRLSVDRVMTDILKADEKAARAIIKRLGIRWE